MTTVKDVQTRLQELGLYTGRIDGIMGPNTLAGIAVGLANVSRETAPAAPTDENRAQLRKELQVDEGRVLHAYPDSLGYLTIGVGRLIDGRKGGGISNTEADYLLDNDIAEVYGALDRRWPEWRSLSPARQRAMANMAFQLGADWPANFPNTWAKIKAGDFATAGAMLRTALWYKQTPARAERVIRLWEQG